MKTNQTLKLLSVLASAAALGAFAARADVREEFHQSYPLSKTGRFQLENVNGSVHVTTWDKEEVKVDAVKKAKKQEHLDEVKIEVSPSADSVKVKTKYPDKKNNNNSTSVEYNVTVPKQCRVGKVSTVNGAVEIENAAGDVEASTVNGAVSATGLSAEAELTTVNGSVKASFRQFTRSASLKSVNGSVTIALPANVNADVSADTANGGIHSDFPAQPDKRTWGGSKMRAKLGEGGPSVKLNTVNGGIHLEQSKAAEAEKP